MTLKSICTSLELSRKLAEAGFEQEGGIAYWIKSGREWKFLETCRLRYLFPNSIRAFTFNELWDLLPRCIKVGNKIYYKKLLVPSIAIYAVCNDWLQKIEKDTPQEAAGELLLWCKDNGYLNATK